MSRLLPVKIHDCVQPDGSLRRGCRCRGRTDAAGAAALIATGGYRWHTGAGVPVRKTLVSMKNGILSSGKHADYRGRVQSSDASQHSHRVVLAGDNYNRVFDHDAADRAADSFLDAHITDRAERKRLGHGDSAKYRPIRKPRDIAGQARPVRASGADPNDDDDEEKIIEQDNDVDILHDELTTEPEGLPAGCCEHFVARRDALCVRCYGKTVNTILYCLRCRACGVKSLNVPDGVHVPTRDFWTCRQCAPVGINKGFAKWYERHNGFGFPFGKTGRKVKHWTLEDFVTVTEEERRQSLKWFAREQSTIVEPTPLPVIEFRPDPFEGRAIIYDAGDQRT